MVKISFLERMFGKKDSGNIMGGGKMTTQPFLSEPIGAINSFSIIPRVYESELDEKYGIRLESLRNGETSGFQGDLENNVSFNGSGNYSTSEIEKKILKKYESTPGFCSMRVGSEEELMRHVRTIHELSYNHYVFGKEENLKGQFPNWCCGKSSDNLLLTLIEKGYPNASLFNNSYHDHTYNGLPFLFGDNNEKGFIIVDPTSDQLFNDKKNAPRNSIIVVSGDRWKYETDWAMGADLFPSSNDNSKFSNLHILRENPDSRIHQSGNIEKYFTEVFKNSVDVKVESF